VVGGLLVAFAGLIGAMLPSEDVAVAQTYVAHSPEAVWEVVTNYSQMASWNPQYVRSEILPPATNGRPRWRAVVAQGYTVTFEQTEADPPRRVVNTIVDPNLPFGGSLTFSLTPLDQGTALTLTSRGDIRNPFLRLGAYFFFKHQPLVERAVATLKSRVK
jgi:uncharacterized protein YndB with AHSA1/START domain